MINSQPAPVFSEYSDPFSRTISVSDEKIPSWSASVSAVSTSRQQVCMDNGYGQRYGSTVNDMAGCSTSLPSRTFNTDLSSDKSSRPRLPWLDTRQSSSASHLNGSGAQAEESLSHHAPTRPPSNTQSSSPESSSRPSNAQYPSFAAAVSSLDANHQADLAQRGQTPSTTPQPPQAMTVVQSPAALFLAAFSPVLSPVSVPEPPLPDAEGQPVVGGYILGPTIGYGGFSIIKKAHSPTGAVVAVKIVRRHSFTNANTSIVNSPEAESALWSGLQHEHVLPLFAYSHTLYASFFVTMYCPAGSLFDILKRDGRPALPHDDAGTLFRQVVRGVRYLHEGARVVHGDIKLENVLLDEMGSCRIADFGMATSMNEDASTTATEEEGDSEDGILQRRSRTQSRAAPDDAPINANTLGANLTSHLSLVHRSRLRPPRHRVSSPFPSTNGQSTPAHPYHTFQPGSLPYAAPELLLPPRRSDKSRVGNASGGSVVNSNAGARARRARANPAQDVWALGVLLYALLVGKLPFWDGFEPRLQMKILHGAYDIPPTIGTGAERVLHGCLDKEVATRWTIDLVDDAAWGIGDSEADDEHEKLHDLEHHHSHPVEFEAGDGKGTRTRSRSKPPTPSSTGSGSRPKSRSRTRPYPSHEAVARVHPDAHPWVNLQMEKGGERGRHAEDNPDTTGAFLQRGRRAKRDFGNTNMNAINSLERNHQLEHHHERPPPHQVWSPSPDPSVVSTSNSTCTTINSDGLAQSHSRSRSRSVPPRTPLDVRGFASRAYGYGFDVEDGLDRGKEEDDEKDGDGVDDGLEKRRVSSRSRVRRMGGSVRYEEVIDEGDDGEDWSQGRGGERMVQDTGARCASVGT